DNNLASPPSLDLLARKSGLCVTYLTETFKKTFGTTVFGYVRQQRLSRAKELIAVHGMDASHAAWEVGYSSVSSFHRAFLAEYGTTPGSYRRRFNNTP
ncbi:MAG: AraC family transcriptional regulator, partial [Desulfobacterales bacterium]|nr:AraC family transcriptional regulator [Desulfobacterales bacterium]